MRSFVFILLCTFLACPNLGISEDIGVCEDIKESIVLDVLESANERTLRKEKEEKEAKLKELFEYLERYGERNKSANRTFSLIEVLAAWALINDQSQGKERDENEKKLIEIIEFFAKNGEREKRGEPPLTLVDFVEQTYSNEEKKEVIRRNSKPDSTCPKFKSRWDIIGEMNDPIAALNWALCEDEPLSKKMIDVLGKTFPLLKDKDRKFQAAALLYRYDRKIGKKYLLKELNEKSHPDAALILALNKEKDALEGIRNIFEIGEPSIELIYAVGKWGQDTTHILSKCLIKYQAPIKSYCLDALTYGKHHIVDPLVIELLESDFLTYQSVSSKIKASSLLIQSRISENEARGFLNNKLEDWELLNISEKVALINVVSIIDPNRNQTLYKQIIKDTLEKELYFGNYHFKAAKELCRTKKEENINLVAEALRLKFNKHERNRTAHFILAQAIYRSGYPNAAEMLKEIMGEEYVKMLVGINELKELPRDFLPESTKPLIREYQY